MKMRLAFAPSALLLLFTLVLPASSQSAPIAIKGYSVSVFATGVTGKYTAPDSIAVLDNRIYIGYGDNNDPAGLDGKSNQIVEYDLKGNVVHIYTVVGHNDGLKVNPYTHQIWAMQNEDADPNLVIIDPATRKQTLYTFAPPPPHGGGYHDIVFRNGKVYFSASNPAMNPNDKPGHRRSKTLAGNTTIEVTSALEGNATAFDVVTAASVTLNLQDPDSMTADALERHPPR